MGELKNLRWPVAAVTLAVTVLLLYGGAWALRAGTQDTPLSTFLGKEAAVAGFTLERSPRGRTVQLELNSVPDLAETYNTLAQGITDIMGSAGTEIAITDRRTPQLSEIWYRVNPIIQEALATGAYGNLLDRVEERAAALGAERVRIEIDAGRVYVQLHQGSNYLYAVLPRLAQYR